MILKWQKYDNKTWRASYASARVKLVEFWIGAENELCAIITEQYGIFNIVETTYESPSYKLHEAMRKCEKYIENEEKKGIL